MLRPNFSLTGLQGVVMPSAPNVAPDCTTILIDWQEQGYTQTEDLPPFVNVPTLYLELVTSATGAAIELPQLSPNTSSQTPRPMLGLVRDAAEDETLEENQAPAFSDSTDSQDENKSEEPAIAEPPQLRLL